MRFIKLEISYKECSARNNNISAVHPYGIVAAKHHTGHITSSKVVEVPSGGRPPRELYQIGEAQAKQVAAPIME